MRRPTAPSRHLHASEPTPNLGLGTMALLLGVAACGPPNGSLNDERQRRIRAESWIAKAEAALTYCRRHVSLLEGIQRLHAARVTALQQELARVRQQLAESQRDGAQCHGVISTQAAASAAAKGVVVIRETRLWKGPVTPAWRKRLAAHRGELEACYRRDVLPHQPGLSASGWVILEIGREGIANTVFTGSGAPGRHRLSGCVGRVVRGRRDLRSPTPVLVAQFLTFAADPSRVPRGPVPPLTWPALTVGPGVARAGQICRFGTAFHRRPWVPTPRVPWLSRPCAPGLRCCYPCGIPGCNSVCMKDCGPPRP